MIGALIALVILSPLIYYHARRRARWYNEQDARRDYRTKLQRLDDK